MINNLDCDDIAPVKIIKKPSHINQNCRQLTTNLSSTPGGRWIFQLDIEFHSPGNEFFSSLHFLSNGLHVLYRSNYVEHSCCARTPWSRLCPRLIKFLSLRRYQTILMLARWIIFLYTLMPYRLAEMIFISPINLVGEINFHLPNWNFHLPNFFLHFIKYFSLFVNYLLLAFLVFFKRSTSTVKKLIKRLNFFPTQFSMMINHKSLTKEYYWVTKSFLQNFGLY